MTLVYDKFRKAEIIEISMEFINEIIHLFVKSPSIVCENGIWHKNIKGNSQT